MLGWCEEPAWLLEDAGRGSRPPRGPEWRHRPVIKDTDCPCPEDKASSDQTGRQL